MKMYDLLWKKNGNEKVGILMDRDGKFSVKIDLVPASNWDGWLVVTERKD